MTINTSTVSAWVDQYVQAWQSNDPAVIGGLFADDALYYTGPFDAPWRGREAIVRGWLDRQDAPESTTFRYSVLAVAEDTGVVRGLTHYHDPPRDYSNLWVIRFDEQGRCREFTEWWMERPADLEA